MEGREKETHTFNVWWASSCRTCSLAWFYTLLVVVTSISQVPVVNGQTGGFGDDVNQVFVANLTTTYLDYKTWNFTVQFPRPVTDFIPSNGRDIQITGATLDYVFPPNNVSTQFETFFTGSATMRDDVATIKVRNDTAQGICP